jgi:lipid-A-disaccharide synthase
MPGMTAFGLGGLEMEAAGCERVVRAEDVAHMGITEVIRHMPSIYREYRRLVASIKKRRPDVAVLIDFPDVNFRLARELKRLRIPVIYFVSPQLWAWKRKRLRWVQERVSRMMVIFPFEERFYRARGVDAEFVGHPLAELALPEVSREEYAARHGLDAGRQWVALLPGSRAKEVRANLPEMVKAAGLLGGGFEFLVPVASTVSEEFVRGVVGSTAGIHLVKDAREALFHARGSVVASGTATVQAAVIGRPFVVVYRVSGMTFRVAKRLVRYPGEIPAQVDERGNLPIGMVNLIAGRRVAPELLQERFTAERVAEVLGPLLKDGAEREKMISGLADVRRALRTGDGAGAIVRVCDAVEAVVGENVAGSGPIRTQRV